MGKGLLKGLRGSIIKGVKKVVRDEVKSTTDYKLKGKDIQVELVELTPDHQTYKASWKNPAGETETQDVGFSRIPDFVARSLEKKNEE